MMRCLQLSRGGRVQCAGLNAILLHAATIMVRQAARRRQQPMLPGAPTPHTPRYLQHLFCQTTSNQPHILVKTPQYT